MPEFAELLEFSTGALVGACADAVDESGAVAGAWFGACTGAAFWFAIITYKVSWTVMVSCTKTVSWAQTAALDGALEG